MYHFIWFLEKLLSNVYKVSGVIRQNLHFKKSIIDAMSLPQEIVDSDYVS